MMNKIARYIFVIVLIAVTAFIVYQFRKSEAKKIELTAEYIKPKPFERQFKSYEYSSLGIDGIFNKHLFLPIKIRYYQNHYYILDLEDKNVKVFERSGKFKGSIGNGVGRGPGEILRPNDFYLQNDRIWITDTRLLRVSRFKLNGTFEESFAVKKHPIRITGKDSSLFIKTIGSENIIKRYNWSGELVGEFGNFTKNQVNETLAFIGDITTYKNSILFVPYIASMTYYYRSDSLYKMGRRPDGRNFVSSQNLSTEDRKMYRAPETDIEARGVTINDSELYIVEYKKAEKDNNDNVISPAETFIDVYDVETGKYQHTFRPPVPTTRMWVDDERLILIEEETDKIRAYTYN